MRIQNITLLDVNVRSIIKFDIREKPFASEHRWYISMSNPRPTSNLYFLITVNDDIDKDHK